MNLKSLSFLFLLFLILFFLPSGFIKAQYTATWNEYSCESSSCGGNILMRNCWEYCCSWRDVCWKYDSETGRCLEWRQVCAGYCSQCGTPRVYTNCKNWQTCQGGSWSRAVPSCKCTGSCLEVPKNPRYYDNPTYSDRPDKSKDPNNIFLPVKLDWDDVAYWKAYPDGPQSYVIRIENTTKDPFSKVVNNSEYTPPEDGNSCLLKSNTTHNWHVKACCNADGTNCGQESNWSFKTNQAPEPVAPYDPDWVGSAIKVTSSPVTFDWCDVDNAKMYILRAYRDGKEEYFSPLPIEKEKEVLKSEYFDQWEFFTKDLTYQWKVAACSTENWDDCQKEGSGGPLYSQIWSVKPTGKILPAELISPPNDPTGENAVGLPVTLIWSGANWAHSYIYEINPRIPGDNFTSEAQVTLSWDRLALDTLYSWKVKSCWEYEGRACEPEWSEEWKFKTTGAPPNLNSPESNATEVIIPVQLDWTDVSGAGSYYYEVANNPDFTSLAATGTVKTSEVFVDYPNLKMLTDYWWRVKTCADIEGKICGRWSEIRKFKTFKLGAPSNPAPTDGGSIFSGESISWEKVPFAKSYPYVLKYLSKPAEEIKEGCPGLVGGEVATGTTVINSVSSSLLQCLGEYQWQVRACLDLEGKECGDWGGPWRFSLIQPNPPAQGGIIPCGRSYDDPNTPYNERESCQFKHFFFIFKIILDFLLWRLTPIMLVLLTLATGVIYYFSISAYRLTTMALAKSIWKAAGIGLFVIFLAWTIINLLLMFFGFQVEIFGKWWQIKF